MNTPRTDAFISKFYGNRSLSSGSRHRTDVELHDFARQLERELASAHEALSIANASANDQMFQKREAQAQRDKLEKALESIREYWNQDRNDKAMFDACWHAIDTAEEVLKECGK